MSLRSCRVTWTIWCACRKWRYCCRFWTLHGLSGVSIVALLVVLQQWLLVARLFVARSGLLTSIGVLAAVPLGVSCYLSCWGDTLWSVGTLGRSASLLAVVKGLNSSDNSRYDVCASCGVFFLMCVLHDTIPSRLDLTLCHTNLRFLQPLADFTKCTCPTDRGHQCVARVPPTHCSPSESSRTGNTYLDA